MHRDSTTHTRSSQFLVRRGPGPFFHTPIPLGIHFITPRLLEVLAKFLEDLEKWKISSFLKFNPLSRINSSSNFTSWDFFHYSSFIYNGYNQNMQENLRFHREFLKLYKMKKCNKHANLRISHSPKFPEDPEEQILSSSIPKEC